MAQQQPRLIGYSIYAIPEEETEYGKLAYGLLQEGLAYDFGREVTADGNTIAIAVPRTDVDTIDLMNERYPNAFWASIGATTAYEGAMKFQDYIDHIIELDDIPPAPFNDMDRKALAISQKTDTPAQPSKPTKSINTGEVHGPTKPAAKPKRPVIAGRGNFNRLPLMERWRLVKRLSAGGKVGADGADADILPTPPAAEPLKLG